MPLLLAIALLFLAPAASAYIGPGAGLSLVGSLLSWLIGIVLAVFAILLWPIRMLIRRVRAKRNEQ